MAIATDHSADGVEVLTFDLDGETFALEAGLVREVLDVVPETMVPGAPEFVGSVINFRGRIIPLADLRLAFGLERAEHTHASRIIVIEYDLAEGPTLIGLRADRVHEVTTIADASTEEAPKVGLRWRPDFIRCLAKKGDDLIVLPELAQIFSARGRTAAAPPVAVTQAQV